jgi:predicted metal-dependent peptidase
LTDTDLIACSQDEISFSIAELIRREPFFGHLLSGLPRHLTTSIDTVAVAIRGDTIQLIVNPHFYLKILKKREHRLAVLKHEVLHIVFKHLFRIPYPKANPILWNIAADLVVNQYVAPFNLPQGAVRIEDFSDLVPDQTAEQYFFYLEKLYRSKKNSGMKALLDSLVDSAPSDHSLWSGSEIKILDGEPVGSGVEELINNVNEHSINDKILKAAQHTSQHGRMPEWLEAIVDQIVAERRVKIEWKRVLRLFASSTRHTKIKTTFRKESRRFESISGLKRFEGLSLKKEQNLAVVIDTSGSVSDEQINQFFAEIHEIYKNGSYIEIVECDSEVKRYYPYKGKTPEFVLGRGGTDFDPAFKWIRQSRKRFDGCIYLTDGYADSPKIKPNCRVLWIFSGGEGGDHLTFGRQVIMED